LVDSIPSIWSKHNKEFDTELTKISTTTATTTRSRGGMAEVCYSLKPEVWSEFEGQNYIHYGR